VEVHSNFAVRNLQLSVRKCNFLAPQFCKLTTPLWRPTADWHCLVSPQVAAQACVCRLWAVACVAGSSGPVMRAH